MHFRFEKFFVENGFEVNGDFAYRWMNGYEVNAKFTQMDASSPLKFHVSCFLTQEQKQRVSEAFRALKPKFTFNFTKYGMLFGFNYAMPTPFLKSLPQQFETIISTVASCQAKGQGFCPVSGNQPSSPTQICDGGFVITVGEDVAEQFNQNALQHAQEMQNSPNNYAKGFVGALIGGLVGAVIFIVLYLLGIVASIAGFVGIALGTMLYQKFGGKPTKMMVLIVAATTFVCIIGSVYGIYVYLAGNAAISAGLDISAFDAFALVMQDEEFATAFWSDLILSVVFTAIGTVYEIINLSKSVRNGTIK